MKNRTIHGLAVMLVGAGLAHAQEVRETIPANLIERNSLNCEFTFFSEGDDILDLRGGSGPPCFDLRAGRDIFALDPGDYRSGTSVHTGPGRDIVVLPDGNDQVHAYDDEDEEYILRGGNDQVYIPGRLASGLSIPGRAERTIVKPGTGRDEVTFGDRAVSAAVRLRSPNLEIWGNESGVLTFDATCGRYLDARNIDATFPENSREKEVNVKSDGCGLTFVRQSGNLNLDQKGGRLNLSVQSEEWSRDSVPAVIKGEVRNGTSLAAGFKTSAQESQFSWQGHGLAAYSAEFENDKMGGDFDLQSESSIYGVVTLGKGNAEFEVSAIEGIELQLMGALGSNIMSFKLVSPETVISWYPEFGRFPLIETAGIAAVAAVGGKKKADESIVLDAISRNDELVLEGLRRTAEGAGESADAVENDRPKTYEEASQAEKRRLLYSAQAILPVVADEDVVAEPAYLKIYRGGTDGKCIGVKVVDEEAESPLIDASCDGESFVADVADYEKILLERAGRTMEVRINDGSNFKVKKISFRK